jgi:hypothetical protein
MSIIPFLAARCSESVTRKGLLKTARISGSQGARISGKVGVRISGTRRQVTALLDWRHSMARRDGTVEEFCDVMVSAQMKKLRDEQTQLNFFLWTTELSYGFALTSNDPRLSQKDALAFEALENVDSEAWFPNTAGRMKYYGRVAAFLDQLRRNVATAAHATTLLWYSHFEDYLRSRLASPAKASSWGPFTKSLDAPRLVDAVCPLSVQTVLRADLCREIRTDDWIKARRAELRDPSSGFRPRVANADREAKEAAEYVVGQALNHLREASAATKELTLSFFYSLFSFTNLDSLAFEIEEALLPSAQLGIESTTVRRQVKKVRRKDLVVPKVSA